MMSNKKIDNNISTITSGILNELKTPSHYDDEDDDHSRRNWDQHQAHRSC